MGQNVLYGVIVQQLEIMMTPHKFRDAIAKLGLSQVKAAHVLGITPRTARRWAVGAARIPAPAAKLLRLMKDGKISEKDVRNTPI
jgi:DNA-binding transcriptional regulator YiaG